MKKECSSCGRVFKTDEDYLRNSHRWRIAHDATLYFNCRCGSTLVLPQGTYPWYHPESDLSAEAKTLFTTLERTDIPKISAVVMQFEEMLTHEESREFDLAATARKDPMFATRILGLANARSRGTQEIVSLELAISSLGRDILHSLTLPSALATFRIRTKKLNEFLLWREGILAGIIAEQIGMRVPVDGSGGDELFLVGSLSCLTGRLLGALVRPDEADLVFSTMLNQIEQCCEVDLDKLEADLGVIPHATLGEIGASIWGFPRVTVEPIGKHHGNVAAMGLFLKNVELCQLASVANSMAQILCWKNPQAVGPKLIERASLLGLERNALLQLMHEMVKERLSVERMLRSWFDSAPTPIATTGH
jgi:HD-like signal output (HDOD) protein